MDVFFLKVSCFLRSSDNQQPKSEKHTEGLSDTITCWAIKKTHNALKKDSLFLTCNIWTCYNSWFYLKLTDITKEIEDIFYLSPEITKYSKTIRGKIF